MAKTPTVTPTNKRLPKANINRIMAILYKELRDKAREFEDAAHGNYTKAREAYLTNALAKHGATKVYTIQLKNGNVEAVYSQRVKKELEKIAGRYKDVYSGSGGPHGYCFRIPAYKKAIFDDLTNGLKELELRLLTADSEHALSLAKQFETTIKGIK